MGTQPQILKTTTGSFPRPAVLLGDREAAGRALPGAVAEIVAWQAGLGLDEVSDGEFGLETFMVPDRVTGFAGPPVSYRPADMEGLAGQPGIQQSFVDMLAGTEGRLTPSNDSRDIQHRPEGVAARCVRFRAALDSYPGVAGFLTAPAPGILARHGTSAFEDYREFVFAVAAALHGEYRAIVDAGFKLQVDSPDLAMGWVTDHYDLSARRFASQIVRLHVEALNLALDGIPPARVRLHVCYGNTPLPHNRDIELAYILRELYEANVGELALEMSNGRHRWEIETLADYPLPGQMKLGVGVIDSVSPIVEHPRTVAAALLQAAAVVGRDRVIAITDCGFGTIARMPNLAPQIVADKLQSLVAGARAASEQLPALASA